MEVVVLSGLQGAGKSTWCQRHYSGSHIRLSLDVVGTRQRETVLLHACLAVGQRVVIDNTNVTAASRSRYARLAHAAGLCATLVVFHTETEVALARNATRQGKKRVPDRAILGTAAKREAATWEEGFDRIFDAYEAQGTYRLEERRRE
jgi:predicted kinase